MPRCLAAAVLGCLAVVWCAAGELPHSRGSWVRLVTSDLELLTTADETAGRSLVTRLERLQAVLQPIVGWQNGARSGQKPICIIDFGSREEFLPYAPMDRSIGYFLPGRRRDFVVLDGSHAEGRSAGHEYVHFVISQSGLRLPTWLNEGLAELYANLGEGQMGQFIPGRVLSLRRNEWIGLADLTAATNGSEAFTNAKSVDSAYAESWLLAHMLVLDSRYSAKFPDLLTASQTAGAAAAFEQVYAKSLAGVERDLKAYLEVGQANTRVVSDPPQVEQRLTVEREADFEGLTAVAEMLANYRGRAEQSRELFRQLEREYPQRF